MLLRKLKAKHFKERMSFERSKEKAFKHLQERHNAVLSIFDKNEKVPASMQDRLNEELKAFNCEWGEQGDRYQKLMRKQQKEILKLKGNESKDN